MSNFSIDGLVTGLSTSSIIDSLMQVERAPATVMATKKAAFDSQATAWNDIATALNSLSTAGGELLTSQKMALYSASSSSPTVASASVTTGASVSPTTVSFRVDQLATAHQVASNGVATATSTLGAGTTTLGVGLPALGIGYAKADGSLSAGAHSIVVTQATGAASIVGGMWGGSVSMGPANNEVTIVVNGVTRIVQIAQGTYSSLQAFAGAVGAAVGVDVSVTAAGGRLQMSTTAEGSAATLQITGGSALASLGMSAGAAVTGTDGTVTVDGVTNTITSAGPGTQTTLTGATGALTAEFSGGLRAGSATAHVIRSGASATLADIAAAITSAESSIRTQTIDVGTGTEPVRLVATAGSTGVAKSFSLDLSGYTGMADGAETLTQGANAKVRVGGLSIERSSNTISDLIPGVSVALASAKPDTDVVISIGRDSEGLASKAKALVDGLNAVLNKIKSLTKYDADKNTAAVLTGDSRARDVVSSLVQAMQFTQTDGTYKSLSAIGISFQRGGTFALDATKFKDAIANDFEGVTKLLTRTATATDSRVGYVSATADTVGRDTPYDVVITQAAEQATRTGSAFATLAANEDITVTSGTGSVTYQALAGATPEAVAAGLNAAFSAARSGVTASVSGGAITLTTTGYGANATLNVTAGASGLTGSAAGVNVVGTIDGKAATGTGQLLTAGTVAGDDVSGLSLRVTATAAELATAGGTLALGSVAYSTGAVGGLSKALSRLTGLSGKITSAKEAATANSKSQQERIDAFEKRLTLVEERYKKQFAALETLMGRLKDQSGWLAAQIQGLQA
ncbi:MAG: flagellar filament capping protein FliD [Gemmatimonadaceae bacterium]|nr:flagellar filament capping protein FliD [Gemmatimonadaceae bacterium]